MPLRVSRQLIEVLAVPDGNLRITQQHVDVLSAPPIGDLRVTWQHVEVLASAYATYEENLADTLNLTDEVRIPVRGFSLSHDLNLTQFAPAQFPFHLEDNLGLLQQAGRVQELSVSDAIAFAENTTQVSILGEHQSFHDNLNLTQSVTFAAGLFNVMEDVMSMSDSVGVIGPIYRDVWTRIVLKSFMPFEDKFEKLTDTMTMSQSAGREYGENVADVMSITDAMYRSEGEISVMNLVQSLEWGKTKGIPIQKLNLSQTIGLRGNWVRSIEDDIGIGHAFTYYLEDPCNKKNYTVFSGESTITSQPAPPDDELPLVQGLPEDERFLLLYPAMGESTDIVELRAPNLDNRERQAFTRINRETRGGTLTIFSDPTWPAMNTLVLTFSGLTKTEVEDTQDFLVSHIGLEVGLFDWEGRMWIGLITTPNEQAVQDGKSGPCGGGRFTISFEFEGVLVEDNPAGSHMTISDSFTYNGDWNRTPFNVIQFIDTYQMFNEFVRPLSDAMSITDDVQETLVTP